MIYMKNKSISWAGCTCDFFSILRNRTMNAMNAKNCSHQLAYSSVLANLDINRTYNSFLKGHYQVFAQKCIYVYFPLVLKAS